MIISQGQMAFEAAMEIFEMTKGFPREETYSLTDQIRRSSRSICANIVFVNRKQGPLMPWDGPRHRTDGTSPDGDFGVIKRETTGQSPLHIRTYGWAERLF
jgi:hypothetical protein